MAAERNSPERKGAGRNTLEVWNEGRLVGSLWRDDLGDLGFRYDPQWLEAGGFPISKTLPLRPEPFAGPEGGAAHTFFSNLLPEADFRGMLVKAMRLPDTDFDLLWAFGGECAGALSIMPLKGQERREERAPPPAADRRYRKLDKEELAVLAARHGRIVTRKDGSRPRLSLAGAQGKCPVTLVGDDFYLPVYAAPTSHILKFESPHYRNVPAYETFTTMLAGAVGLPVVDIRMHAMDKAYMAVVKRYDRESIESGKKPGERPGKDGGAMAAAEELPGLVIRRLHQEDFCQALGYSHGQKYQDEGGPSLADCCRLVRETCKKPEDDVESLLHWQIFNVLAGNSDGHAKNLSLLYHSDDDIRLAPFYDLVCTRAIATLSRHVAFFVGGESDPGLLAAKHWKALAQECDVPPAPLLNLLQETAAALRRQMQPTLEAFTERYGPYPALQRVEQVITKQCRRALKPDFYA